MTEVKKKRHRLSGMVYDEVSLVDTGANQHAHVVIAKADTLVAKEQRKAGWYSSENDGKGLGSTNISAKQRKALEDDKVKRDKSKRDKDRKESERAEKWKEERHKRAPAGSPAGGEFDETDSESKRKYGRGGTTKEKLERLERRKQRLLDRDKREKEFLAQEKVKAGDTLWAMAVQHYGDGTKWKVIAAANGITDPKKLQVGAVIKIPKLGSKGSKGSDSDSSESGSSGSSSRRSSRRRGSSSDSDEGETREERLKDLQAQRKELLALLQDVDSETSTRRGDIEAIPGVTIRPDGTIVRKNRRRR